MSDTGHTPLTKVNIAKYYDVTKHGDVFSKRHNWRGYGRRKMATELDTYGYPRVKLTIDGRVKRIRVHLLVAMFYLGDRPQGCDQIRHLNGNKADNRASNLKWGTAKSNAADRDAHATTYRGSRHHSAKLNEKDVTTIRCRAKNGETYASISNDYPVGPTVISEIARGKIWKAVPR